MSSAPPPEFFFDRSLGKKTGAELTEREWIIHHIADYYSDDAQSVEDERWIAEGTARGWALLTKDQKIRYRGAELAALHGGQLFCLANGNLTIDEMVERFDLAQAAIERAVAIGEAGFWHVYAGGKIVRKWP
jgi:hypothetical protein